MYGKEGTPSTLYDPRLNFKLEVYLKKHFGYGSLKEFHLKWYPVHEVFIVTLVFPSSKIQSHTKSFGRMLNQLCNK